MRVYHVRRSLIVSFAQSKAPVTLLSWAQVTCVCWLARSDEGHFDLALLGSTLAQLAWHVTYIRCCCCMLVDVAFCSSFVAAACKSPGLGARQAILLRQPSQGLTTCILVLA